MKKVRLGLLAVMFVLASWISVVVAQSGADKVTEALYAKHRGNVFTIEIVETLTQSKVGHGTGFLLRDSGLIVSNYHVIAEHMNDPAAYRPVLRLDSKTDLAVQVLDFDIIHDLALLRVDLSNETLKQNIGEGFHLSESPPAKGRRLYALGNPIGLGLTIVPGVYNGLLEQSLVDIIHFTGAINPGMSGGPTISRSGVVAGVNVATSGNSIGYLVPVRFVRKMVQRYQEKGPSFEYDQALGAQDGYRKAIAAHARIQLKQFQRSILSELLSQPMPTRSFRKRSVVGALGDAFACSGRGQEKDIEEKVYFNIYSRNCFTQGHLYLNSDFSTGQIHYNFHVYSGARSTLGLSTLVERHLETFSDNYAAKKHVTEYSCVEKYTEQRATKKGMRKSRFRTVYCTRQYQNYLGLGDVFFLAIELPQSHDESEKVEAFVSEYALAGVTSEMANAFLNRFLEALKWQ